MSQQMLARYYLLPNIGRLSLCTVEWQIFVTRLFGDLFRLFQSCPYDFQNNGARVRAAGIVGILTHPLNRADTFFVRHFFVWHFFLPSVLPAVNCACAHKKAGRYDSELPRNVLWNNPPYFRVLVPILFGKCSNLPDLLTKNIGCSSLAIVVVWLCCCKLHSPCYCQKRSCLGLVSNPFLWGWGVISFPFLHYKTSPLSSASATDIATRGERDALTSTAPLICWGSSSFWFHPR